MATGKAPRTAQVQVPVLREVLARLGSEKGNALVGEVYDLVTGAVMESFEKLDISPIIKAAAKGPVDLVLAGGRGIVMDWARRQTSQGTPPSQA
jgi:hypothetical protein